MSGISIAGLGAVSPAGWTVASMRDALELGKALPPQPLADSAGRGVAQASSPAGHGGVSPPVPKRAPGTAPEPAAGTAALQPQMARLVPAPAVRPEFLSHPRLRRTSPITHYAASAALEALAGIPPASLENARIGLIVCLQSGCVQYSCRFYDEVLKNPGTASPLLFPETVYAAPASHIATLVRNVTLVSSQVGDPSCFLLAMAQAAQWLTEERADFCLVIGAEEPNWITADALRYFDRTACISAGAGAVCLCRDARFSLGVELTAITDAHTYSTAKGRIQAAMAMRNQLDGHCGNSPSDKGAASENDCKELLCDGLANSPRMDRAELAVWRNWTGPRLSPGRILGQGLMAAAAWQCVAACDALARRQFKTANVSMVGVNQQAIGAKFQVNDTAR